MESILDNYSRPGKRFDKGITAGKSGKSPT
jgi:hypothetical protein